MQGVNAQCSDCERLQEHNSTSSQRETIAHKENVRLVKERDDQEWWREGVGREGVSEGASE
jgi:hypothetical protein